MEIFKNEIETNHYSLFVISDVHEGNAGHNEKAFNLAISYIHEISKQRHTEVVLNGDIIDCIDIKDKRFNPVEIASKYTLRDLKDLPRKQADYVIEKLQPIKNLISYAVIGNHEETYIKEHHFNVYDYYCQALGCKKLGDFGIMRKGFYSGDGNVSTVIDIGITHGKGGGGRTAGYALNYIHNIFDCWDVDLAVCGHIHQSVIQVCFKYKIDRNLGLKTTKKIYAVCPPFLETFVVDSGGYMEGRQGAQAIPIGILEFTLDKNESGWQRNIKQHFFNEEL